MKYKLTQTTIDAYNHDSSRASQKMTDAGGLYLLVTHTGRYWRYNYRHDGKSKTLALGVYPAISIKQARETHQAARAMLQQGIDPSVVRRTEKDSRQALINTEQQIVTQLNLKPIHVKEAEYLKELETQGIGFYYSHSSAPYINGFFMTAEDLILFRSDPVLFLANQQGVDKEIYLKWMNANHDVQCSAVTGRGRRCKNFVKRGVDAKTFEQMQNARCIQH